LYDITARGDGNGTINGTSDFQDNLAAAGSLKAVFGLSDVERFVWILTEV